VSDNSTPKNIHYVIGATVYNVSPTDDIINVDTSLSPVTVVLPNIQNAQLNLFRKNFYINDAGNNAFVNNITIIAAGGVVNSGQVTRIKINTGSAVCTIVDINEYQVITDSPASGGGSNVYGGASPTTVVVENFPIGTNILGLTYDDLFQNIYAPYTPPIISLVTLTPASPLPYNEINVNCNVTFNWTKGAGTPNLTSAQIQYQRAGDLGWTNLTTTTAPSLPSSASSINASATVSVNAGTPNNASILFRCIFVNSVETNTSSTATIAFLAYVAPTATLVNTPTPSLTSGKQLRSLSTAFTNTITGTIVRNSVNIDMNTYILQRSYNNSTWTDLTGALASTNPITTVTPTVDSTQPANQNNYYARAFVVDGQNYPVGAAVSAVSSFGIYQPVFFGMTTTANPTLVNLSTIGVVPQGTGLGTLNYTNTSADKNILGLSFVASTNRFCVAFDNSYGTLSVIEDVSGGLAINLISNFTSGTQVVTFADGTTKTYIVYVYTLVVSSGTYIINIS
jgi:hypothetical protein